MLLLQLFESFLKCTAEVLGISKRLRVETHQEEARVRKSAPLRRFYMVLHFNLEWCKRA